MGNADGAPRPAALEQQAGSWETGSSRSWRTGVYAVCHAGQMASSFGSRDPMAARFAVGEKENPLQDLWAGGPAPGGGGGCGILPAPVLGVDPGADPYTRDPLDNSILRGVAGNGYALLTTFRQTQDPLWFYRATQLGLQIVDLEGFVAWDKHRVM